MLTRIATAVVLIPIVLALILRAPVPVLAAVAAIVALLTIFEFLKLTESYGVQPLRMPTYIFVGVFFLLLALNVGNEKPLLSTAVFVYCLGFAAAIAPFLALSILMLRVDLPTGYPAAAASVFAFTYIALPMGMLVQLRQQWAGAFYLLYLLLVVWAGDIFAYFVGKAVGRHLMSRRITWKMNGLDWMPSSSMASARIGAFRPACSLISTVMMTSLRIRPAPIPDRRMCGTTTMRWRGGGVVRSKSARLWGRRTGLPWGLITARTWMR